MDIPVIKIKKVHPNASIEKSKANDAAYTIKATERSVEKGYIRYKLGIATEIPIGWVGLIFPRSSISGKDLALSNAVGVIDPDYRGEWEARFKVAGAFAMAGRWLTSFFTSTPDAYEVGDGICQVIFIKLDEHTLEFTDDELSSTDRGEGGFGSTDSPISMMGREQ